VKKTLDKWLISSYIIYRKFREFHTNKGQEMKTLILIIISLVTVSEVSRPRDIQEFDFNKKSEVVEFLSQFEQIQ